MGLRLFGRKQTLSAESTGENGKTPIISLREIVKTYSNAAGDFTVLKEIETDIYKGEFVAVIGKSGSGKSTLINMITGIDRPTSGEIYVNQTAVHTLSEGQMAVWRGRNLGIVFQFFQLLPMLSLVENIMLPMDFCKMYTPRQRKERAMELLRMVEMEDHAKKLPSAISGGQQQRVAIARALANDPPLLLADEPTGNLDSKTASVVFDIFEGLIAQGKTVVMVTHDSSQAQRVSRTILLADGEIVNEYVAQALPTLTHEQMLHASRKLQPLHFEPGATILKEGEIGDQFYIVTRGQAEVAIQRPGASDVVVANLGVGQYFGEIKLLRGGANTASVRAAGMTPVEVVALDKETFRDLLEESEATRQALEQIAESRLAENLEARNGNGGDK
jgi:ABC-type lipoprotein export system ATPase subunit